MKLVLFRPKLRKYLKSNLNPNTGTAIPLILIGTVIFSTHMGTTHLTPTLGYTHTHTG
jgi:hypothetical protein